MENKTLETIISETTENATENMWGTESRYNFKGYEFLVRRRDLLDYYGNPIYIINPVGYVNELPKLKGFRRNNINQWYTTQSYNIDEDMSDFFRKLDEIIDTPKDTLYHSFKAVK